MKDTRIKSIKIKIIRIESIQIKSIEVKSIGMKGMLMKKLMWLKRIWMKSILTKCMRIKVIKIESIRFEISREWKIVLKCLFNKIKRKDQPKKWKSGPIEWELYLAKCKSGTQKHEYAVTEQLNNKRIVIIHSKMISK